MTARPSGAFCSAPSPMPSAIGIMPMIIASAVISTGRIRVAPASSAAAARRRALVAALRARTRRAGCCSRSPRPCVMIAPVSAGTRQRRAGDEEHPGDAGERRRQRGDDDDGVDPRLEVDDDQQVDEHDRHRQADAEADERGLHRLAPGRASSTWLPRGSFGRISSTSACTCVGDAGEVGALHADVDVDRRRDVVARDDRRLRGSASPRRGCRAAAVGVAAPRRRRRRRPGC